MCKDDRGCNPPSTIPNPQNTNVLKPLTPTDDEPEVPLHDLLLSEGKSIEGTPITMSLRSPPPRAADPLKIGIDGKWYDLTKYLPYHPGGDVMLDFHNLDATAQFYAYHNPKILAKRKPIGTYEYNQSAPGGNSMQAEWRKLSDKYESMGYLGHTPKSFICSRFVLWLGFVMGMLTGAWVYTSHGRILGFVGGCICMAFFWQQSGFLMHDTMHNHLFHNRKIDQKVGWFFGCVCFGVSSKWWRDEHNEHHLYTNTIVDGVGVSDPQMFEAVWVQDPKLIPFLWKPVVKFILKFQKYYFVPICVLLGPYGIRIDSLVSERRIGEFTGIALHYAWITMFVSTCFKTWKEGVLFVAIGMLGTGVLSIQLLVSHYSKPFEEKDIVNKNAGSWAERQVDAIVDISCPPFMDWFHGGLNLHSPHHLFPRMARCYYREVHQDVVDMCKKHGVELEVRPWFDAVRATLKHLGNIEHDLIVMKDEGSDKKTN